MKVAIFGDSYADELINKKESNYKSWVEILREKYYADLTCYAESGSSLYFSYELFLTHQSKYDKIIFITTTEGRLTIPKYIKFNEELQDPWLNLMYHINSIETAEYHLKNRTCLMTEEGILATKAAIDYFKYLYDSKYQRIVHNLIKSDIQKVRSDAVVIDINPYGPDNKFLGLSNISFNEFDIPRSEWPSNYHDRRMCHLSQENNEILAEKVYTWCNGVPVNIDLKDFVVLDKEEFSKYIQCITM